MSDEAHAPEESKESRHFPLWFWIVLCVILFLVLLSARDNTALKASRTFESVGQTIGW